jgi:predicted Fe-Mo cluster-binding NifX family protein
MKICIPVEKTQGTENTLHGHFYSSPRFIVYDTKTKQSKTLTNPYEKDDYKIHKSFDSLSEMSVHATVVGGLGRCALLKLNRSGVKVYQASGQRLKENIDALEKGELTEFTVNNVHWGHEC